MGIFGTSDTEEAQLRSAAQQEVSKSRQSLSSATNSSAYETAPEFSEDDEAEEEEKSSPHAPVAVDSPQSVLTLDKDDTTIDQTLANAHHGNDDDTIENFYATEEMTENTLNRKYTLERIVSHKSVQEVGEEELARSFSQHTPRKSSQSIHNADKNKEEPVKNSILVNKLDWDGPDDKANPHNWPQWKKWWITFTVALVCLCCSLGSSLYVGSVPELVVRFHASTELVISGLTFYMLGLGFGPLLTGPLSEKLGRRWIYVLSFPIGMLFNLGIGFAKNLRTILVLRFFVGLFSSPALALASGTISDLWSNKPEDLSFSIALFCLAPFLGPVIGPIVGGFAGEHKGWKWPASWVYLMFSGAVYPSLLLCPETYRPIILKERAKKRSIEVIEPPFDLKKVAAFVLLRPVQMLAYEPIVSLMSIYVAFIFAVLFGFFEAFPIIFRGVYGMDIGVSGLPFISVGLGLVTGVILYVILDKTIYFPKNPDGTRGKRDADGNIIWAAPEEKLLVGKIGAVFLPIALFWLGWTGRRKDIHWMAPTAAGFPFGLGLILVFFSVVGYFSMAFPPISVASAMSANNVLRYVLASVFPLFTMQMYNNLGIGWASSLFGFIALLLLPVPFVFEKIGPKLRAKSRYGYAAYFKQIAEQKKAEAEAEAAEAAAAQEEDEKKAGTEGESTKSSHETAVADKSELSPAEEMAANKV